MKAHPLRLLKVNTLRSYITLVITGIITISLIISCAFFYQCTSRILTESSRQQVMKELVRVNKDITDQVSMLDSVNSMFISNTLIREAIEPSVEESGGKLMIEKQMRYLLLNTYPLQNNFINGVCIFTSPSEYYTVSFENQIVNIAANRNVLDSIPTDTSSLIMKTDDSAPSTLYFTRNIFSTYTGEYIATILINVSKNTWISSYSSGIDKDWFIYFYNEEIELITNDKWQKDASEISRNLSLSKKETYSDELDAQSESWLVAAEKLPNLNLTSAVAAPRSQILKKLNATLQFYLLVLIGIVLAVVCISFFISQAITRPISNMIYFTNRIAEGDKEKIPPLEMYTEFNQLATAFNNMLDKLNTYHKDNLEKQLLLKNAEIQALQSQMDPHFLFNTLNTIAWKAQMTGSQEIYQMVISLGELLKSNARSKDVTYVTLEAELKYVKFYTYLQKMRFEDKISVVIQADQSLFHYKVPCFSIQPLVENAFIHGLEPKKGNGKLVINVIRHETDMEILVVDNGVGFQSIPDLNEVKPSSDDPHTHIAMRNLDRRLYLLFGEMAHLQITSTLNVCTTISFKIPLITEE